MKNLWQILPVIIILLITSQLNALQMHKQTEKWSSINKCKFPNAHEVLLDEITTTKYDTSGVVHSTDDVYIKILDEKGIQDNQTFQIQYDRSYDKYDIKKIELIKPVAGKVPVDIKANMRDQVAPGGAGMNIYDPDQRLITVQIPGIGVNDILHYTVKYYGFKPRIKGQFADFEYGQYKYPYIHMKYILTAPKSDPLKKFVVLDGIKSHYHISKTITDNSIIYTFEVNNVPQIIPEPSMPAIRRIAMRMLASTISNWKVISKWYYNLVQPHLAINQKIKDTTDKLIAGKKNEIAKIKAIFFYVSRNIRYMGVTTEKNKPGLEPHDAIYTFESGTGVCRDKAALIVAMLRYAGIDANVVLFSAGPKLDKEVPMTFFNHAIAAATLKNGKTILIDPTDETGNTLFPQYEADMSYLLCTKQGNTLKTSPFVPAQKNNTNIHTNITYKNNKFYCNSTIVFYGINDNIFRGYFAELNKNKREEFINSVIKSVALDSTVEKFQILPEHLLRSRKRLMIKVKYTINSPTVGNKSVKMFQLPLLSNHIGLLKWAFGDINLRKRHYPLKIRFTASVTDHIVLKNENSSRIKILYIPERIDIHSDGYTYKAQYKIKNNIIEMNEYCALDKLEYSPKEYKNLKNYLRLKEIYNKKTIITATRSE